MSGPSCAAAGGGAARLGAGTYSCEMRKARPWRPVKVCDASAGVRVSQHQAPRSPGATTPHLGDDGVCVAAVGATTCAAVHSGGGNARRRPEAVRSRGQLFRHPRRTCDPAARPALSAVTPRGLAARATSRGRATRAAGCAACQSTTQTPCRHEGVAPAPTGRAPRQPRRAKLATRRDAERSRRVDAPRPPRGSPRGSRADQASWAPSAQPRSVRAASRWTTTTMKTRNCAPPSQPARAVRPEAALVHR